MGTQDGRGKGEGKSFSRDSRCSHTSWQRGRQEILFPTSLTATLQTIQNVLNQNVVATPLVPLVLLVVHMESHCEMLGGMDHQNNAVVLAGNPQHDIGQTFSRSLPC